MKKLPPYPLSFLSPPPRLAMSHVSGRQLGVGSLFFSSPYPSNQKDPQQRTENCAVTFLTHPLQKEKKGGEGGKDTLVCVCGGGI